MSNVVFFDGVDDYVTVPDHASLRMTGDMTIECLFKTDVSLAAGRYAVLLTKGLGSVAGGEYSLWIVGCSVGTYASLVTPSFWVRDPTNTLTANIGNVSADKWVDKKVWNHVTVVHEGTNLKLYINGYLLETKAIAFSGQNSNNNIIEIGSLVDKWYSGLIANARIYNRALSDTEVLYNYSHPNNPIRRGIALNFTQDSIYGTKWQDLSGNANNGTYVGGAVPVTANRLAGR